MLWAFTAYYKDICILSFCHEGVWGCGCIDPHLLDLGTSWRWVVSFTYRELYPWGKSPRYTLDRMLGGRRAEEKIFGPTGTRTPTPRSSSVFIVITVVRHILYLLIIKEQVHHRLSQAFTEMSSQQKPSSHRYLHQQIANTNSSVGCKKTTSKTLLNSSFK
jgi:hypothetical protein